MGEPLDEPLGPWDYFQLGFAIAGPVYSRTKDDAAAIMRELGRTLKAVADGDETLVGSPEENIIGIAKAVVAGEVDLFALARHESNNRRARKRDRLAARELVLFLARNAQHMTAFKGIGLEPEQPPAT